MVDDILDTIKVGMVFSLSVGNWSSSVKGFCKYLTAKLRKGGYASNLHTLCNRPSLKKLRESSCYCCRIGGVRTKRDDMIERR
jgi:hypothetical protein